MNTTRRLAFLALLLFLSTGLASAQNSKKESTLRTVLGTVTDKTDNPLPGGVVFLKNVRTGSINTRFADKDGNYRFSGLDPNADYEIHAEFEGGKIAHEDDFILGRAKRDAVESESRPEKVLATSAIHSVDPARFGVISTIV